MKLRNLALAIVSLALALKAAAEPFHLEPAQEKKAQEILNKLSLEEKIGQLAQYGSGNPSLEIETRKGHVGSFLNGKGAKAVNQLQDLALQSKSKIPLLIGFDVIHGFKTIFPIPLAESCSWDPALAERVAAAAALEANAAGVRWTFAPMVDIARDPRWGRIMEGAGEDPSIGALFAAARVQGFQKDHLLIACAKHFVGYGAAEAGRDYNSVELAPRRLWETYYPPFEGAVDGGVATFMSSFNTVNGVPLAADPKGLRGIIKDAWGFQGFVVSDWGSISELMDHGVAADKADAAQKAILAGVDMDMAGKVYAMELTNLVKSGVVPQSLVDDAVLRILRAKLWLGLFEHPKTDTGLEAKVTLTPKQRALAREAASRSCVLLKNEGILPLSPAFKRIAVIGPLADSHKDPLGNWSARGEDKDVLSVLDGLRERGGNNVSFEYVSGCAVRDLDRSGFDKAVAAAKNADAVILVLGEDSQMSGEAYCRTDIGLPGVQHDLAMAVMGAGKPTVLLLMNGRPLTFEWEADHVPAILETWFLGVETGPAVAGLLFGDTAPEGHLTVTFPRNVGQIPIYHSVLPTGRPESASKWTSRYIDSPNSPRYPFGYGLTYTQFGYSDLKVNATTDSVIASVKVSNLGKREGVEVAQLYLHDKVADVSRPGRELKGFARVALQPGETRELTFTLQPAQLGYYHRDLSFGWEPGDFVVWVGSDSLAPLSATVTVPGKPDTIKLPGSKPGLALVLMSASQVAAHESGKTEFKDAVTRPKMSLQRRDSSDAGAVQEDNDVTGPEKK